MFLVTQGTFLFVSSLQKHWSVIDDTSTVVMEYTSKAEEENYPGQLKVKVTYELTNENEFIYYISATTTKATPVNMTCHMYFNLAGHVRKLI